MPVGIDSPDNGVGEPSFAVPITQLSSVKMLSPVVIFCLFSAVAQAAPTPVPAGRLGLKIEKRGSLPTLTLSDATYRADNYNAESDIYKFKNIRFAAAPVGDLRWAKPAPPPRQSTIQDGSYGPQCPQAPINGLNLLGDGSDLMITAVIDKLVSGLIQPLFTGGQEDCLFLDVYVPGSAVRSPSTSNLPVIHWFYGGGFVFGNKDEFEGATLPFYDGTGMIKQSGNNVIYVASNYRVGAFGFLAGTTMEKNGLPNAGFWDQRAALQWTQDNIHLLGGDPTQVTVMGESAGAGSILHHLTAGGGTIKPLFKRAVMLSPAFQPMWDRKGGLEIAYQQFESLAGCSGQGLPCLRNASSETLISANMALDKASVQGSFNVGPAVDGSFVRQLPALELASGNYNKEVDALLISHTANEATLFVDGHIATDAEFSTFLGSLFSPYVKAAGLSTAAESFYPPVGNGDGKYTEESQRLRDFIRDSSITCNARWLSSAFSGKTYNMQYSTIPGWHATDLLAAFWDTDFENNALGALLAIILPGFTAFSNSYKSYLTSFVRTGNPNTYRAKGFWPWEWPSTINWPIAQVGTGEEISNVLDARLAGFSLVNDDQNLKTSCDFWLNFQAAVTSLGGYSPPGSVVGSTFVNSSAGASANY